jgi:tetratricopeptide (TPR) repeat protein
VFALIFLGLGWVGVWPTNLVANDFVRCSLTAGYDPIAACAREIASGRWQDGDLASLYRRRASAYAKKSDYDHAIEDYDAAILIYPIDATAYRDRAGVKKAKGDFAGSNADIAEAARLESGAKK